VKRPPAGVVRDNPPLLVGSKNTQTGPTYPRRVQGRERTSVERAAPPACGGRDLLGVIKKMMQALPEQGQYF
ncbi:hypothetical protein AVEN_206160-1, partial [Araneus ventricosus]